MQDLQRIDRWLWLGVVAVLSLLTISTGVLAQDGNRLAYLDGPLDPYYPHRDFPKLITPQWVGEEGVDAVVTLAIDDMRDSAKYEAYLRPILDRLKKIDGRAPVSIMACQVQPDDPQLQAWLKEGLSIECHTFDHPCPCLQNGGLAKAKETYDKCVDLVNQIPGNKPVAFRMPCCDSKNTPSPRFWAEVFNKTTEQGNFLQIDSSVFNIITSQDKELPKEITLNEQGEERFRRYVPFTNFVNAIEDYPYPYIIGGMCWEFPCVVPSDWSAQHVQKPNNPDTVRDWKLALDAIVLKKGVFNLVFHPHGWIRAEQIVELIDHAQAKHGKKVKFLTFKECAERLNRQIPYLPLRDDRGSSKRVSLADANGDKFLDTYSLVWGRNGKDSYAAGVEWDAIKGRWERNFSVIGDLEDFNPNALTRRLSIDPESDRRLLVVDSERKSSRLESWQELDIVRDPFELPGELARYVTRANAEALRFIDVNGDSKLDCLFSNAERYSLHLFKDMQEGWSIKVIDEVRGKETGNAPVIPPFVRADGTNNGAWFHSQAIWVQNEDTWNLPDGVQKVTFEELLAPLKQDSPTKTSASGGRKSPEAAAPAGLPREATSPQPANAKQSRTGAGMRSIVQAVTTQAGVDAPLDLPPPSSPEEALKLFDPRPGMKVELVAAEPLIVDPVAFDWGPDGRLWVVEMRDYPNGLTWRKPGDKLGEPGGRIKVLTDENGDGRFDKATVFLEGLSYPTGIKVWRKGVLITAAPEILYAEDADGDGQAEVKETLYVGFGTGNQQHRVNGLRWGVDGWLYVGNGDSGGKIKSVKTGEEIAISGRDLRIRPDTGELEAQSGQTQFGRESDDWGNWFGGNNSNPMWHYVLEDHYLKRNPHFAAPDTRKHVPAVPGAAPVFPTSRTLARFNDFHAANRFTSACSPMIYRDELLGEAFVGNAFVCEPVHNLVHREVVRRDGASFRSERAADERESEFLASRDNWFRPVMARTGPDGALWIADMYRLVIEHPEWIPKATQEQIDLRGGEDKGRIWRITPSEQAARPFQRLDELTSEELIAALDTPNGWQRDMVQQLLLWRNDKAAAGPLVGLLSSSKRPQTRLAALATLQLLGEVPPKSIVEALGDQHPEVRRFAVRLCEESTDASVLSKLRRLTTDDDAAVRLQLACTIGQIDQPWTAEALATLVSEHPNDPYLLSAVASSLNAKNAAPFAAVLFQSGNPQRAAGRMESLVEQAAMLSEPAQIGELTASLVGQKQETPEAWQIAAMGRVLSALDRRKLRLEEVVSEKQRQSLEAFFQATKSLAVAEKETYAAPEMLGARVAAIALVGKQPDAAKLIQPLLSAREPAEVQSAAVQTLVATGSAGVTSVLETWGSLTPSLREQALGILLTNPSATEQLLGKLEAGSVGRAEISARHRQLLLANKDASLRGRAEAIFSAGQEASRQKVLEEYRSVKPSENVNQGQMVFKQRCANCHRLNGEGHAVGPDLAALTNRSPEALLTAILDPNRAVEDKFLDYAVLTTDGRQVSGMLVSETGASITLAGPEGKQTAILRSEIDELRSTGKSLMPEGMERDISLEQMSHLLAYLGRLPSLPQKSFPGNVPEVARLDGIGRLVLLATAARIYGPSLVLEERYRNLGYWQHSNDHAIWTVEVPAEGKYRVQLDYACENGMQGNTIVVQSGGGSVAWKVEGTGSWDNYRGKEIGTLDLPAGEVEMVVRSEGAIRGALLDLRSIRLIPVK